MMSARQRTGTTAPAWRERAGFCGVGVLDQPAGILDDAQRAHLVAVAVQLKAAHDVVAGYAGRYSVFPEELSAALARELAAIRALLDRYHLIDRNARLASGRFADEQTQIRFDHLVCRGNTDRSAAIDVVSEMLGTTVAMIDVALPKVRAPDVRQVYLQLYTTTLRQGRLMQAWSAR
jgi:hypothetical protein